MLVEKHRLQASIFVLVRADVPREKKDMGIDDIHCEISGYAFYFDFYDPLDGLPFFTYKQGMHLMKSGLSADIVRAVTTRQERRVRSKNCSREELFMDVILKCPEQVGLPISMLRGSIGSLFGMMERMAVDVEILL